MLARAKKAALRAYAVQTRDYTRGGWDAACHVRLPAWTGI